jgi:hypothetical protein
LVKLTGTAADVRVKDAPKETPKGKGGFTGGSKPRWSRLTVVVVVAASK